MRWYLLLLPGVMSSACLGQERITARVIDGSTGSPLHYASVAVIGSYRGAISNGDGWFSLLPRRSTDSIHVSHVGYTAVKHALNESLNGTSIRLTRSVTQLDEVIIRPEEDHFKRVLAASARMRRAPEVKAKAFHQLETHSDGAPVELLQACYTATYRAAAVRSMELKQGRIGIAPKEDRHFINHNTAGALLLLDPHSPSDRFPTSPLEFTSARALRRMYRAELVTSGLGPDGTDHLRLTPADSTHRAAFTLDLWLTSGTSFTRAFELTCTNCEQHPFTPLFPDGRLHSVDMRYKQTWSQDRPSVPVLIEFDYSVDYAGPGFSDRFRTSAILHAYERGSSFLPVLFPVRKGLQEYPSIAWLPFDSTFWAEQTLPIPTDRQAEDDAFIMANDVLRNAWFGGIGERHYDLRPHYLAWSADTRLDTGCVAGTPRVIHPGSGRIPDIHFRTHLYLNLDTLGANLRHRSISVFDAGDSWHRPQWTITSQIIMNIFFDLAEVERRRMDIRLGQPDVTLDEARKIHREHTAGMRARQKRFLGAVAQSDIYLLDWNRLVREELGVNNLDLLQLRISEP